MQEVAAARGTGVSEAAGRRWNRRQSGNEAPSVPRLVPCWWERAGFGGEGEKPPWEQGDLHALK